VIGFFGTLLPPPEITQCRFQECGRIIETPETPITVVAKETSDSACAVVMVDRKSTCPTTTTPVSFKNPADGTSTILLIEKGLVPLA
jgi:hypothetical protein